MTRLTWEDLTIDVPAEVADQPPEAVLEYERAALDAACRAKHGVGLDTYRAALAEERAS